MINLDSRKNAATINMAAFVTSSATEREIFSISENGTAARQAKHGNKAPVSGSPSFPVAVKENKRPTLDRQRYPPINAATINMAAFLVAHAGIRCSSRGPMDRS